MSSVEFELKSAFVVDDDDRVSKVVTDILTEVYGLKVEEFGNPEWALGRMGIKYPDVKPGVIRNPDIIFTDYNFHYPPMNGIEFIRQVRNVHPNLPIVLMSADLWLPKIQEALPELDLAATLEKPFRLAKLTEALEDAKVWKKLHP